MPTAGILRPAEVVFYHPLDNFVESAVGQTWTGSSGFTPGKIGSANSAVAADAVSWGPENDVFATADTTNTGQMATISPTKVVVVAGVLISGSFVQQARVGTVSGTDITWGTAVTVRAANTFSRVTVLDATTLVFVSGGVGANLGKARAGSVSGNEITLGTESQYSVGALGQQGSPGVARVDDTRFLVGWNEGSFSPSHGTSRVGTVSGTDITYGAAVEFDTDGVGRVMAEPIDSTTLLLVYAAAGSEPTWGNEMKALVATVSGTDVTYGAAVVAVPVGELRLGHFDSAMLSATSFIVAYRRDDALDSCTLKVGTISGTDLTFGPDAQANDRSGSGQNEAQISVTKLTSTSVVVAYLDRTNSTGQARSKIATISGTDITFGSESDVGPLLNAVYIRGARLSSSSVVMQRGVSTAAGVDVFVGTVDFLAGLSAPTPASYPSTIGATRIVTAFWAKNPTKGSATVKLERGYSVTLTATSIALGGTTATWNSVDIDDLMTTLNDDGEHLLVLDFEHASGTDWTLRTSVDGGALTSQGTQDSGTQAVTAADTAPEIALENPAVEDQWVDEAVMWSGDKATFLSFETQELANLQDLADTFDEPMNQYEENFGAPICWQATAKMPDGTVWRDSGSGPCPPVVRVPRGAEDVVVTDDGSRASPRIIEG